MKFYCKIILINNKMHLYQSGVLMHYFQFGDSNMKAVHVI